MWLSSSRLRKHLRTLAAGVQELEGSDDRKSQRGLTAEKLDEYRVALDRLEGIPKEWWAMSKRHKSMTLPLPVRFLLAALGLSLLSCVLRAQLKPTSNAAPQSVATRPNLNENAKPLETLKVNVNLVSLYFTVHDKNGALISTLTKDDFTILEDKVPQTIKNFETESDQPLSLGILLDTSGSVANVLSLEQQTGLAFLKRVLRAKDEAFLVSFDENVDLLADYTNNLRALEHAMNNAQIHIAGGFYARASDIPGTVLYDAVYLAAHDMLAQKTGRKALIILSDGEDQGSQANLEDAIEFAQRVNSPVYVILTTDRNYYAQRTSGYPQGYTGAAAMAKLAEQTGGRLINVGNDGKRLKAAFDSIEQELRTEYVIGYTPTNGKMDGSYRRLDVNVKGDGLTAQVRKGYYAVPVPVSAPVSDDCQTETSRSVPGGGISAPGWVGSVDPQSAHAGLTIKDAKLSRVGDVLHVTTGPAASYWSTANSASGDYAVSATFTEPKYRNLSSHPHPYGIFIAGNNMGTGRQSELYCAASGDGNFIVRGFGPKPFQMNGPGTPNAAVHKAAAPGQSVSQKIVLYVSGDIVGCAINGVVVASFAKSQLVMAGKLKSTDGVYGIRFAQNTEGTVTDLKMKKLKLRTYPPFDPDNHPFRPPPR